MKKALITGITGEDDSYLAEPSVGKSYEMHGIIRRASAFNTERIDHLYQDPQIHGGRRGVCHGGQQTDALSGKFGTQD
jgi:GDPmannose 4,6-dehydratase